MKYIDSENRIKVLRISNNLKSHELAEKIGVIPSIISKIETKKQEPSIDILFAYSDYFKVSIDYLLGRTNINTYDIINNNEANILKLKNDIIDKVNSNLSLLELEYINKLMTNGDSKKDNS